MKKTLILIAIFGLLGLLAGCNLFTMTTTEETTTVTVVTDSFVDIHNAAELQAIEMNQSYRLVSDIDISDLEWVPLGTIANPYLGIFDGNGHTISGLTITAKNFNLNGLFGYLSGEVKNLTLTDVSIDYRTDSLTYAGAIAAFSHGFISDCQVFGTIRVENTASNILAGLLAGYAESDLNQTLEEFVPKSLSGNYVQGTVEADAAQVAYIGGFVGKTYNVMVHDNVADATVSVTAGGTAMPIYVGGFIGHNYGGALYNFVDQVEDPEIYVRDNISFSVIDVTNTAANLYVGGFMAFNQKGFLRDNYAATDITLAGARTETNTIRIGGFLAENFESAVERAFVSVHTDFTGFTGTYEWQPYVTGDFSDIDAIDVYLYLDDVSGTFDYGTDDVTLATLAQKDDPNFYQDNLGWSTAFVDSIMQ